MTVLTVRYEARPECGELPVPQLLEVVGDYRLFG